MIKNEPGRRVGDFSLGPRVLIDYADLPATGLLDVRQPRPARAAGHACPTRRSSRSSRRFATDFKDEFVSARSYRATDDEIGEDFDRAENYLSLVGLVIVILGGIAVSSVTRVFVLQKMRSIAVLKCVGARSAQIIAVYMLQVMTLGLAGSLLGVVLARLAIAAIPYALDPSSTSLLADVALRRDGERGGAGHRHRRARLAAVLGRAAAAGAAASSRRCCCATKPAVAARDWTRIGAIVLVSAALVALTSWQAASLRVGLIVCARILRAGVRAANGGSAAGARDRAARERAVVSAAPRGAAHLAPRQSDARDPAGGRPRRVLHRRRPLAPGQPARGVFGRVDRRTARTCS